MPTIENEGLVEFVRQHPPLGVELLRHVGTFALPAGVTAFLGSEDMSDVTPRANGRDGRQQKPQKYTADSVVVVSDPATAYEHPEDHSRGPAGGRRVQRPAHRA